ncbi:hypothetical protein ACLOJK_011088 [Asimina triloba]
MSSSFAVETIENQSAAADRGKPVQMVAGGEAGGETGNVKAPEIERDDGEKAAETEGDGDAEIDEEEGECGFCLFMKGGGCRESFIAWEKCVEEAENNKEDIVDKCFEITGMLKKCMEAHSDYYAPVLQAEKAMEEEAAKELERGAAVQEAEDSADKEVSKDSKPDTAAHGSEKGAEKGTVDTLEGGAAVQEAENSADKQVSKDSKRDTAVHGSEKASEMGTVERDSSGQKASPES